MKQNNLELAADLGHAAASEDRTSRVAVVTTHLALHDWAWVLSRSSPETGNRCAVVGGRIAYALLEHRHPERVQPLLRFRLLLDSLEKLLLGGDSRSDVELFLAEWQSPASRLDRTQLDYLPAGDCHNALNALYVSANCALCGSTDQRRTASWHSGKVLIKLRHKTPQDLQVAVAAELVPWALGYSDPVRERVEARQQAEAAGE